MIVSRRLVIGAALALPFAGPARAAADASARLAEIEAHVGGRLGVAITTASGEVLAHWRGDERFPMCSTFKALLAAAVLARVDAGAEDLAREIAVSEQDILEYAPVTKAHVGRAMSVAALCDAAVRVSDNTAANLLLKTLDGPAGLTRFVRATGDGITRLDRFEPDLNEAVPGDPRDTTTPVAMARTLGRVTLGDLLRPASRERLTGWLEACETGRAKLRAGLPADWRVGDKTGSGERGSSNDVAVVWPTGRAPLVVTSYLTECAASDAAKNAAHAEVGRVVAGL